jgi:hypothetical protein
MLLLIQELLGSSSSVSTLNYFLFPVMFDLLYSYINDRFILSSLFLNVFVVGFVTVAYRLWQCVPSLGRFLLKMGVSIFQCFPSVGRYIYVTSCRDAILNSEIPGVASLVLPFLSYIYVTSCTDAILNSEIPGVASLVLPFLSYIYVTSCRDAILNSEIPGVASLVFYIVEQRYQYLRNEHFF